MTSPPIHPASPAPDLPKTPQKGVVGQEDGQMARGIAATQGRKAPTQGAEEKKVTSPMGTVPQQLAKDFLSVVKKGNMKEIVNFIRKLVHLLIEQFNIDVTKVVDDQFRHTCLYYAALIKDANKYGVM